ncbi:hypothetical protein DFH27DRAFT_486006, partial [Peziza echinospora]
MTPRDKKPPMPHPTMTAVNTQVQQVQVPPTIAREIRSRHVAPPPSVRKFVPNTPGGSAGAGGGPGGKNMTLKEQSAIIDKLQKENFDLKIKVYYLNERLEKVSEEGVAEVTKENLELKLKLNEIRKDLRNARKEIRDLKAEKGSAGDGEDGDEDNEASERRRETEIEVIELRERCERFEVEITRLRRKIAGEAGAGGVGGAEASDTEILRDLLENEALRREQAEMDNQRLRDEIARLQGGGPTNLHPPPFPTNSARRSSASHSDGGSTATSLRQSGQLKMDPAVLLSRLRAENEELKRDLGAQTSMLTSRNRERDGLYAQIEDLKLSMRSGGAGIGSAGSDQHGPRFQHLHHGERSMSRNSFAASLSTTAVLTEAEREDMENLNGMLRDRISELKLRNQELELQLESAVRELEEADRYKVELERTQAEFEEEVEVLSNEVRELQSERNILTRNYEQAVMDFEDLKLEAEEELEKMDMDNLRAHEQIQELEQLCNQKDEDFEALQGEMGGLTDHVVKLEDLHAQQQRRMEDMMADKHALEQEISVLEKKVREEEQKVERINVQLESAQQETTFLREEQDQDKMKIGVLERTIKNGEDALREEREKTRDWERRFTDERRRGEKVAVAAAAAAAAAAGGDPASPKTELERKLHDRNQDLIDEIRRLRSSVSRREQEAKEWRDRVEEVEGAIRDTLGDVTVTKTGMLTSIGTLQRDLEQTLEELDTVRRKLVEREQTLRDREDLLENMAIENKKLTEILEKEKVARRADIAKLESIQNSNYQSKRQLTQNQTQMSELQQTRSRESRTIQQLEQQLRDQIADRNGLLVTVWNRLSALCGPEWTHRNALITSNSSAMEAAVVSAFSQFSRNLMHAIKTIEGVIAGFKTKCKSIERDLSKDYQVIESALDSRTRRLERLESLVRGGLGNNGANEAARAEVARLRGESKALRIEVAGLKKMKEAIASQNAKAAAAQKAAAAAGKDKNANSLAVSPPPPPTTTLPHTNTDTGDRAADGTTDPAAAAAATEENPTPSDAEKRWILRLRELEKRLKAEREARLLDRSGAKKRLEEAKGEKEELRMELERER